MLKLTQNPK